MPEIDRHVHFEVFKSSFKSWESLFEEATTFADGVGPERLRVALRLTHNTRYFR
jgi:hypothetical protein